MYNCFFHLSLSLSLAHTHSLTFSASLESKHTIIQQHFNSVCISNNFGNTWIQNEQPRRILKIGLLNDREKKMREENSDFHIKAQCLINEYHPTFHYGWITLHLLIIEFHDSNHAIPEGRNLSSWIFFFFSILRCPFRPSAISRCTLYFSLYASLSSAFFK